MIKRKEIPWGEAKYFDIFGEPITTNTTHEPSEDQLDLEDYIHTLSPELQEIYYLRYGEKLSLRRIAYLLGFNSPWPIQTRLKEIEEGAKQWLKESQYSSTSTE